MSSPTDITALPKVELHLHIEGTLEPELIFELASRHGMELPYASLDDLRARYAFEDLQSFLDLYYANMAVLRTADDFARLTAAYLRRAAAGGVRHAEIFFDPQAHLVRGVPLAEVVEGLVEGAYAGTAETGTTSALIACFLRDRSSEEALEVLTAGCTGVTLFTGTITGTFDGRPMSARLHYTRTWVHADETGWRILAARITVLPPAEV